MSHRNNELGFFRENDWGLFPRGFFSNLWNDSFWENFNFGGLKVDIREKPDCYIIEAEMPGVDKNAVQIDVRDNVLTITAVVDESKETRQQDGRYLRKERRTGSFRRRFTLDNVNTEGITANMENGILTIHCPKQNANISNIRRIPIE